MAQQAERITRLQACGWIAAIMVTVGGVGFLLNGVGLLALPYVVQRQTRVVHASQGYIEAQQQLLRQYRASYDAAGPEQRAALLLQMRETADLIPQDVQPDISAFLSMHRGN